MSQMSAIIYGFKNRFIQQDCTALLWENPQSASLPLLMGALMNLSSRSKKTPFPVLTEEPWCLQKEANDLEKEDRVKDAGLERSQHTERMTEEGT